MPKFEVQVTRTKIEYALVSISAKTIEDAEKKVKAKVEPDYVDGEALEVAQRREKAAVRFFDNHLAESADHSTEFEYETEVEA